MKLGKLVITTHNRQKTNISIAYRDGYRKGEQQGYFKGTIEQNAYWEGLMKGADLASHARQIVNEAGLEW